MGVEPVSFVHRFMDEEVRRFAWGHRRFRHDYDTARALFELYKREGLGNQVFLEVVFHIAADYGVITPYDYEIMKSLFQRRKKTRKGEQR